MWLEIAVMAQVDYIDSAEACASECAALPNCTHWCASPHRARQLPLNPPSPRPASTTRGGAQDALETLRHMLAQGTGIRRGGAESVRWAHLGTAAGGRAGGGRAGGRLITYVGCAASRLRTHRGMTMRVPACASLPCRTPCMLSY